MWQNKKKSIFCTAIYLSGIFYHSMLFSAAGLKINKAFARVFEKSKTLDSLSIEESQDFLKMKTHKILINDGVSLQNYCKDEGNIKGEYPTEKQLMKAKLSLVGSIQYQELIKILEYLSSYAHFFKFSQDEFSVFKENIFSRYCSENISVISLQALKIIFDKNFKSKNPIKLPSISDEKIFDPFFLKSWKDDLLEQRTKEFLMGVKTFQAFCSWGNIPDDFRLMTTFLKNPFFMARSIQNILNLKKTKKRGAVICEELVCRPVGLRHFGHYFPKTLGSMSLEDDLKKLYCNEFAYKEAKILNQEPQIREWLLEETLEEKIHLVSLFLSFESGLPEFLFSSHNYQDFLVKLERMAYGDWDLWAEKSLKTLAAPKDLNFEEPIKIQIKRNKKIEGPLDDLSKQLEINIDINLGEFDEFWHQLGKLKVTYPIELSAGLLNWVWQLWYRIRPGALLAEEKVIQAFSQQLKLPLDKMKEKLVTPPWKSGLAVFLSRALIERMVALNTALIQKTGRGLEGFLLDQESKLGKKKIEIPLALYYGPWAVKYLNDKFRFKKVNKKLKEELNQINETTKDTTKKSKYNDLEEKIPSS